MSETVTKVVQGVDRLFDEIVVNGRTVKSAPQVHTQNTNPSPAVTEPVEGQYVGAVQLNNTIHGLKDVPLTQRVTNLESGVSGIEALIPSEASSSNKLADKNYVDTATGNIEALIPSEASSSNQLADKGYVDTADGTITAEITAINAKIPAQASAQNQLADKNFVNSSVATNTANYISNNGLPFSSVAELEAYSGTVTNNDYAFVTGTDSAGNTYYDRYKATVVGSTVTWALEYRLNNSSFTAEQWATINSGLTSDSITNAINALDVASVGGNNKYIKAISEANGKISATEGTIDSAPTSGSSNPVSSDGVYQALQQGSTPVNSVALGNMSPVTSNAVAGAFNSKVFAKGNVICTQGIALPTGTVDITGRKAYKIEDVIDSSSYTDPMILFTDSLGGIYFTGSRGYNYGAYCGSNLFYKDVFGNITEKYWGSYNTEYENYVSCACIFKGQLYVGRCSKSGNYYLYKGGTEVTSLDVAIYCMEVSESGNWLLLGTSNGIYKTSDGTTFTRVLSDVYYLKKIRIPNLFHSYIFAFKRDSSGTNRIYRLYDISTSGSINYTSVLATSSASGACRDLCIGGDGYIYLAGGSYIRKAGKWNSSSTATPTDLFYFESAGAIMYDQYSNCFYLMHDWTSWTGNLWKYEGSSLSSSSSGIQYVQTESMNVGVPLHRDDKDIYYINKYRFRDPSLPLKLSKASYPDLEYSIIPTQVEGATSNEISVERVITEGNERYVLCVSNNYTS